MDGNLPDREKIEKEREEQIRAHLDRIYLARMQAAVAGPLGASELRQLMDSARTDTAYLIQKMMLLEAKPSEIKALVQSFEMLDNWLRNNEGTGGIQAVPVSQKDVLRVEAIIKKARGLCGD